MALIQDPLSRLFKICRNPIFTDFQRNVGTLEDPSPESYQGKLWRCEYIKLLNQVKQILGEVVHMYIVVSKDAEKL